MSSNHFLNACPAHTSTSTRISLLCFLFFLGKDWDSKSTAHIPSGGIFLIYAFSCKNPSSRAFHCLYPPGPETSPYGNPCCPCRKDWVRHTPRTSGMIFPTST